MGIPERSSLSLKIGIVVVLVALVGMAAFADNNVRDKRAYLPIVGGGTSEGGEMGIKAFIIDHKFVDVILKPVAKVEP